MKTAICLFLALAISGALFASCSGSKAAPASSEPTEVRLTLAEQGQIPDLLKTYFKQQQDLTETVNKLRGAVDLLHKQKGLDDSWVDQITEDGSGIKFIKKPASSPSPTASPAK